MRSGFAFIAALAPLVVGCVAGQGAAQPNSTTAPPSSLSASVASAAVGGCALPNVSFDLTDTSDDVGSGIGAIGVPARSFGKAISEPSAAVELGVPVVTPRLPSGMTVRLTTFTAGGNGGKETGGSPAYVAMYLSPVPIAENDSLYDIFTYGGGQIIEAEASGQDAALVRNTIGDLATIIRVGDYDAALTHSDPYPGGSRTWALYWSDGKLDYTINMNTSAAVVIATAQSIYCTTP